VSADSGLLICLHVVHQKAAKLAINPQKAVAKFGCRTGMEVEKLNNLSIFWLGACLNVL
jgi:hypothetical protein